MTDGELLELAAKAAGYRPDGSFGRGLLVVVNAFTNEQKAFPFDPINDDGDALRLAANLRLAIKPGKHLGDGCTVETQRNGIAGCTAFYDDKAEQMRRAIVSAAAEIGRQMDAAISAADSR